MSGSSGPGAVVIGGGIAGLAAAWRLQQQRAADGADYPITLLEASDRVGGKLRTEQVDGLTIEAGPDSFLSYKPAGIRLARELGIEDRIIGTRESGEGASILRDGRLEPLPEGITMLVPTRVGPLVRSRLLSARGKARLAAEYFISPRLGNRDESIGSFITRRLGREAFEHMAQPLLSGIYAGDADQLSLAATFPRLRDIERNHGGLVRGMLAQRREAGSRNGAAASPYPPFVSFASGMEEFAKAILERLTDVDVRTDAAVERVERAGSGFRVHVAKGEPIEAEAVLLATPAFAAADVLQSLDGEIAALLRRIPYVSSATISLAYRSEDLPGVKAGRGFVIPAVENRELTAVTWASNKFDGRAPNGLALLRAFVGRAGREAAVELGDDDLLALATAELRDILGIEATPVLSRISRWNRAMPQYIIGHLDRLKHIDQRISRYPGLSLLGAAYRGVGIPDCIESGFQTAAEAHERLTGNENKT